MTAKRVVLFVCLMLAGAACASGTPRDDVDAEAQRIFSRVMSPYCPGLLLADCPSPDAFALRAEIRARLAAGEAPAEVENALYLRFGESVRAAPRPRSWGLLLWVVPIVVLAASIGGVVRYLARRQPGPAGSLEPAPDPGLERRLDDELERL